MSYASKKVKNESKSKKERKKERKSKKVRKLKMLQAAPPYTTMEVMTIGPKRAILKRKQVLKELS